MKFNKIKKDSRGFTIVELLIVIVVIGLLAALVIVQFTNVQARARDAERKSDIRALQSKVAEYYALNGAYPTSLSQITSLPADACKAPGGTGTCAAPDYGYFPFLASTTPTTAGPSDCQAAGTVCGSYIIFTQTTNKSAMEQNNVGAGGANVPVYSVTSN